MGTNECESARDARYMVVFSDLSSGSLRAQVHQLGCDEMAWPPAWDSWLMGPYDDWALAVRALFRIADVSVRTDHHCADHAA